MNNEIIEIANKIKKNGGCLFLVGGAVRDQLLNINSEDEDYCVTGISHEEFIKLFPNAIIKGKSFEVFEINKKEFALARTEEKIGKGHKQFNITTNKNITIVEDLQRRDITINSIAKNVLTEEIIDPFNGREDLQNKIIRATSPSFKEDPLRVYRAARFASRFNFKIEENTLKLMKELKNELNELSVERVFIELKKALQTNKPSIFFNYLKEANVLDVHFIELFRLIGATQPIEFHPEGDSFVHTMCALDMCASITKDEKVRFAVLVHDLGKGITPKEELPHHYNHDENGINEVIKMANRLKIPNDWCNYGTVAAKEHMKAGLFNKMTPSKKVTFIERNYKSSIGLEGLEIVVESDRNCRGLKNDHIKFANIGNKLMTKINGNYIKEKYNLEEGIKLKEKMHQERVNWLKDNIK